MRTVRSDPLRACYEAFLEILNAIGSHHSLPALFRVLVPSSVQRGRLIRQPALPIIALSALTVLLWSTPVLALDPSLDVSQYAHIAWTFRNGFSNGAVYSISQTADGYLWLGTQSGVVRFDGVRAVPLALPPGQQLPSAVVEVFLPARDGTLWIGTHDGLVSWKNGQLTRYPALAHHIVITLLQDRAGTVWAGAVVGPAGKLCAIRGESTTCYGGDGSLGAAAASLYEDSDGSLWVGAGTGIWRWNSGPPTRYLATPIRGHHALTQGDHGSGLMVASDSVRQIVGTKAVDYPLPGAPLPLTAANLLRDRNGGLWIGTTAHGIVHSYEGKTSLFTHNDGLSSDHVNALFEDREGTIWVATSDGFDQFRELPVTSLSVKQGLSSASARSVLAARDGSIWIGTADGLNRWNHGRMTIYRRRNDPGLPDDEIQSLFEDERGRIWVSGYRGLAVFEKGKFTAVPSVPAGYKHAIAGDNHGGLWLSLWLPANDCGLAHLVDGKIIERVPWQSLGGGPGSGLVPDPDGGIWAGMVTGGIALFRAGHVQKLPSSAREPDELKVMNLSRGRDGTMWAATENGVSRIANGRVATLTTADGLPCNAVYWIIEDDRSSYWLHTQCGLLRMARTELDAWTADPKRTVQVTALDAADGGRLVPAPKGYRPWVSKSSDGKIWFVNHDEVSFIDPSRIGIDMTPPAVHVEQITANGKTYDLKRGLRLPPLVHDLTINYTALNFATPHNVHFRYKLEGQDPDWREVVDKREAQYSNLPPRNYRFRVTASNDSGMWNNKGDVFDFSIALAYYQTDWFRALCGAIFLALLWAAYQFLVRQLRRDVKKLRDVIETIPAMAWTALPDGSNEFVNRRWAEYTGLSAKDTAGSGWTAAVQPDDSQPYSQKWRASLASGEPFECEVRLRCSANGEYRWFLARGAPQRDEHGKLLRWYGILTDIEDRKRAEQERAKVLQLEAHLAHIDRVSLMGELAASIAHEISQPLTAIATQAAVCLRWLAMQPPHLAQAQEAAEKIARDSKYAGEVIQRVRGLFRRTVVEKVELDLNEVIDEALDLLGAQIARRHVALRRDLRDIPHVMGDRVQLQQLILNLVLNGLEAMDQPGLDHPKELVVRSRQESMRTVVVEIHDCGVGLQNPERIFEPFFTTKKTGTGLGLPICRSIVKAHGGNLWAVSSEGPGTTFRFTLPVKGGEAS
jgi:PAS domain S-box-containing protein